MSKSNPQTRRAKSPPPNDAKQSHAFIEKAREIEADEKQSAADNLLGRMAKDPPEPRMQPKTSGKKIHAPVEASPTNIGGVSVEQFVVQWTVEGAPAAAAYKKQYDALQKVGQLFDAHGRDLEVAIHLNRVNPPPSVLFNAAWLRKWNKNGRQPITE